MMRKFHWKNIIFLFMLTFSSLTLKAQTLNFEETVKYIQDKFECCAWESYACGKLQTISKYGRLTFEKRSIDLFDWTFDEYENLGNYQLYTHLAFIYNQDYIRILWKYNEGQYDTEGYDIANFHTPGDAEKVYNAFKHLKTLCTPEVDPFGN